MKIKGTRSQIVEVVFAMRRTAQLIREARKRGWKDAEWAFTVALINDAHLCRYILGVR